jgi:hypothetical protein
MVAAALLISLATASAAQSCLGVPTAKRHALGLLVSGPRCMEGDDGGACVTFGMTSANESSARLEFAVRPIVIDNSGSTVEDFNVTRLAATMARPLGTPKASASAATTSGFCGMAQFATAITSSASSESDLGRAPSPSTTAYSMAAGGAWAISTPTTALYAGPLFGISSANDQTALFTTFHAGGGIRLGRLFVNADAHVPMGMENAKSSFDARFGFMW